MRDARARAASSMIQPPMLDPTRICGSSPSMSSTAIASSAQHPIVPAAKSPLDAMPEIIETQIGAPPPPAILFEKDRLRPRHVGTQTGEKDDPRRLSRQAMVGDCRTVGAC